MAAKFLRGMHYFSLSQKNASPPALDTRNRRREILHMDAKNFAILRNYKNLSWIKFCVAAQQINSFESDAAL